MKEAMDTDLKELISKDQGREVNSGGMLKMESMSMMDHSTSTTSFMEKVQNILFRSPSRANRKI